MFHFKMRPDLQLGYDNSKWDGLDDFAGFLAAWVENTTQVLENI